VRLLLAAALAIGCLSALRAAPAAVTAAAGRPAQAAAPGPTTLTARELVQRSELDMRTNPEQSRRDAEQALAALARAPDPDLEIRARLQLCEYQSERNLIAAEEQVARAAALIGRASRPGLLAGVRTCAGELREAAGDTTSAGRLYSEAVNIAQDARDDEMLAEALFSRGYLLGLQGRYAAGLSDLRRAQSLFEHLHMPRHALTALNSIAILYNRMGDYAHAREIYLRALDGQRAAGFVREQAVTSYNLGRTAASLGEWPEARHRYTEALELSRRIGYARGQAYALRGLGSVADAEGNPGAALANLAQADALQGNAPDERLRAQISLERGVALHRLHRLEDSERALDRAMSVFLAADALGDLAATYAELAAVEAARGDYRAAYERERDFERVTQRLLSNQLDQRFETLKVEFDTAAQEKENARLQRENAADRTALAQAHRVRTLQGVVIALTVALAVLLATLAVHQRGTSLRMRRLALTDELTGVPNRRAVLGRLAALLAEPGGRASILILDIDHFKAINDLYGHSTGDEVLKAIAAEVRGTVRAGDFCGRLGGEEFLVVLPQTPLQAATQLAERLRERIALIDTQRWFGERRRITASAGLTRALSTAETPSTMLQRADAALYRAKRSGRDCVRTEPPLTAEVQRLDLPPPDGPELSAGSVSQGEGTRTS